MAQSPSPLLFFSPAFGKRVCPAPARESKLEPDGGKGGCGGNVEREEGEMAPLEHLFKVFFLDDFSPSLLLQSEFSQHTACVRMSKILLLC